MALSPDIISQFVKVTNDRDKSSKPSSVYGTAKIVNGKVYVKIDGSDQLTPVTTVTNVVEGERVTVQIKDHIATATGNITSPAARGVEVEAVSKDIGEFKTVTTVNLKAVNAEVTKLSGAQADFKLIVTDRFEADEATIDDLTAENVVINKALTANKADIGKLKADNAVIQNAVIKDLTAEDGTVKNLNTKFASIDFGNIGQAAFEYFYSKSGLVKDVVIGDGTITGELVGVTIKGDLIEAGTLKADRLVVRGSDGKYYKLNTNFEAMEGVELVEEDAIHGSVIVAKSITAEKVAADDLVAFGATIGGFHISTNSIYSGVKESINNSTPGFYIGDEGHVAIGDDDNYIKFYENDAGDHKLEISLIDNLEIGARNLIRNSTTLIFEDYYFADQATSAIAGIAIAGIAIVGKG